MELIKEMEKYLPIPAYPTPELCHIIRQKGLNVKPRDELKIISIFNSGVEGGIVCTISENNNQVFIVSLTHLRIKPEHPLKDKIITYQKNRNKKISSQKKK